MESCACEVLHFCQINQRHICLQVLNDQVEMGSINAFNRTLHEPPWCPWFHIKPNESNSRWPQTSTGSFVPCSINTNMVSSSVRTPVGNVLRVFTSHKVSQLSVGAQPVALRLHRDPFEHLGMPCLFMKHDYEWARAQPCLRLPCYLWSPNPLWGGDSPLANTAVSYCSCCRNSIRAASSAKGGHVNGERRAKQCKASTHDSISP